jgi:hypothetical protein
MMPGIFLRNASTSFERISAWHMHAALRNKICRRARDFLWFLTWHRSKKNKITILSGDFHKLINIPTFEIIANHNLMVINKYGVMRNAILSVQAITALAFFFLLIITLPLI